jgi:hypothetical protein
MHCLFLCIFCVTILERSNQKVAARFINEKLEGEQ